MAYLGEEEGVLHRQCELYFATAVRNSPYNQSGVLKEQQVVLVPMRAGSLSLPAVTVQLLSPLDNRITCETYVENAAEAVHVLPAKSLTTVLIPMHKQWPAGLEEMARG